MLKEFGGTNAVQKFWILRKRLENQGKRMAPQVGLEPTTLRLTAGCSAIELLRSESTLERVLACQRNHIRANRGLELLHRCTSSVMRFLRTLPDGSTALPRHSPTDFNRPCGCSTTCVRAEAFC